MESLTLDTPAAVRSRKPRRPVARETAQPERRKVGVYLSIESYRRLGLESLMSGDDLSQIVDRLIRDSLRRYVVQDRAKCAGPATESVSAESSDQA